MDSAVLERVFESFAELLSERFSHQIFTTEDSVRYTFYHCLGQYTSLKPSDIVLEHPHSYITRGEIDTCVLDKNSDPEAIIEFKYHRPLPSGHNTRRTEHAAEVFADLFRLALFEPLRELRRYFIYVTASEMANYFLNPENQLNDFFNLGYGEHMSIVVEKLLLGRAASFTSAIGKHVVDCNVIGRFSRDLPFEYCVRIYEVQPLNSGES